MSVFIPTIVAVSAFFVVVASLAFRAQMRKPQTGTDALEGEIGVVKKALTPEGKVFVHGELWQAKAKNEIGENIKVRVVNVQNLILEVEPHDENTGA